MMLMRMIRVKFEASIACNPQVPVAKQGLMTLEITSVTALLAQWSAPRVRALFAQVPRQAAQWASVLAREGLPEAQLCYGRMLLAGTGVSKDEAAALGWFRRAARSGHLDAINMVGRCLDNGWGAAEDPVAAAEHYLRAATAGHAWAQYNLGHLYLDGRGVPREVNQAYTSYRRAADQRHERAMNLVGRCCEEGWGTARDPAAAAMWYQRSAEAGYFRGQYNWASVLLAQRRFDAAAVWFERAVEGGTHAVRMAVIATIERAVAGGAEPRVDGASGDGCAAALYRLADRLRAQQRAAHRDMTRC